MKNSLCSQQFWDVNQTWNCESPTFSTCFEDVVFISLPCISYSIILLLHLLLLPKAPSDISLPWAWLNFTKILLSSVLWCLSCIWCGIVYHEKFYGSFVPHSSVIAATSKFVVFLLVTVTMLRHKSNGVTTSLILSTFWLLFSCCCLLLFRSALLKNFELSSSPVSEVVYYLSLIFYPVVFVELFLSFFVDKKKYVSLQESKVLDELSFVPSITFVWFIKYVLRGKRRLLTVGDLCFTTVHLTARYVYAAFEKHYRFYLTSQPVETLSLTCAILKACWLSVTGTILLNVVCVVAYLISPLILDRLIHFAEDDTFAWRGYFYAFLLFTTDFVKKILQNVQVYMMSCTAVQFQSCFMSAMFRKNLRLSTASRKEFQSGAIMSLLTVDVKRLQWFTYQFAQAVACPLKVLSILYILWQYIGIASLAGIAVMVLMIPVSFYFAKLGLKYSDKQLEVKDVRLKLMNEILSGIKILKLYAWEIPFSDRITKAREEEIKWLKKGYLSYNYMSCTFFLAPMLVSVVSFATYLWMDSKHTLDPTKAFVTLALMEQLKYALFEIPDCVADLIQFKLSIERLSKFFNSENKNDESVGKVTDEGEAVTIRDASFTWSAGSSNVIHDLTLHVPKGKLIAVIGPVGSGKSSLLCALLGELHKVSGTVDMKGSVAYVPQQPWVLNRSLRDNVLLVKRMSPEKYNKILDVCCLRPDLAMLSAGDKTEIGEKGINLSGGQKLRVNLAQAVYQDKDIYLLDDPLSAVDVHVRKSLFADVIGNTGLLRNKTRILVTHDVSELHNADLIVSVKEGKVDEMGTYKELIDKQGSFASFVNEHSNVKEEEQGPRPSYERGDSVLSKMSLGSGDMILSEKHPDDEASRHRLTEDERMELGGVHRFIYFRYIKRMSLPLFFGAACGIMVFTALQAASSVWLSEWSSDGSRNSTVTTSFRLSIYGTFGIAEAICIGIGYTFLTFATAQASKKYHRAMLDCVIKSPMSFFDSTPAGRILNRFGTDLEIVDNQIYYRLEGWLSCVFSCIASFAIIGINIPIFLLTLLPLGAIYYLIQWLHLTTFRQLTRLESTGRSPIYSLFLESIQGASSIVAYGANKDFVREFEEKVDNCFVCMFSGYLCNRWLTFNLDTLGSLAVMSATVLAIYHRAELSPAIVALIVTYALTVTDDMKWFVRMNSELESKSISIERVDEFCDLKPEAPWDVPHPRLPAEWPQKGCIVFQDYSTRYRENLDLVLKEINLSIESCEKVGIIGRTGAGKSSITLALFRIIEPTTGTIFIDDVDISKIGLHNLRSKLTIIPQDPVLFNGTLRINLDPNQEYADDALWCSLEQSHLKDFVSSFPDALSHDIEEGGSNLSAGQRQLVCLARALLKNSKVLVLDEATASVDMDTDSLIQNTIRTAFADRTVITIAHRINTVLDYDKIVVMEEGQVVEVGNPGNLLQDETSHFYTMNSEAGLLRST